MQGIGYWVIRTYVSGNVGEKIKYWIPGEKPTASRRKIAADIRKQDQNKKACERTLARIINTNFTKGDVMVGLDYDDAHLKKVTGESGDATIEKAEKELRLCLRRVKRAADKLGITVRMVGVTSDTDGETGDEVRVHHHLIVNREAARLFGEKWKCGGVNFESLKPQQDYTAVAHYMIAQVRHVPDRKKYMTTRNLKKPEVRDRVAKSGAELSVPRGCTLLHRSEYNVGMTQYIRYYIQRIRNEESGIRNEGGKACEELNSGSRLGIRDSN